MCIEIILAAAVGQPILTQKNRCKGQMKESINFGKNFQENYVLEEPKGPKEWEKTYFFG